MHFIPYTKTQWLDIPILLAEPLTETVQSNLDKQNSRSHDNLAVKQLYETETSKLVRYSIEFYITRPLHHNINQSVNHIGYTN